MCYPLVHTVRASYICEDANEGQGFKISQAIQLSAVLPMSMSSMYSHKMMNILRVNIAGGSQYKLPGLDVQGGQVGMRGFTIKGGGKMYNYSYALTKIFLEDNNERKLADIVVYFYIETLQ